MRIAYDRQANAAYINLTDQPLPLGHASHPRPATAQPRCVHGHEARSIAKTAAARQLLTLVFYAMRDGHVRGASSQAA